MFKQQKGITLIALVITIIVLLILAGITIAMLTGNDSAPQKAQAAAADTKVAEAKEQAALDVIDKYTTYMAGKYQADTVTASITEATFTEWVAKSANAVSNRANMFSVSGTTITIIPQTSDEQVYTGTITNGGSITWVKAAPVPPEQP